MDDPNQKFQPPQSNIFVRTMEDDLKNLQNTGGQVPNIAGQPVENLNVSPTPPPVVPSVPPISTTPEPIPVAPAVNINNNSIFGGDTAMGMMADTEAPKEVKGPRPVMSKKIPTKLIMIGGIAVLVIGGALAFYFLVYPKLFDSQLPIVGVPDKFTCDFNYRCIKNPVGDFVTLADCQKTCIKPPVTVVTSTPVTIAPPLALVTLPYNAYTLPMNLSTCATILTSIKAEVKKPAAVETFKILMPKFKTEYLSNPEITGIFIPKVPKELSDVLKEKYLVFAYYGTTTASLGLAMEVGQANIPTLKDYFLNWEKKTIVKDLSNFFVTLPATAKLKDKVFKARTFQGADIRGILYTTPQTVLTYGFFNDYLIITTSNEAMDSAVSHLQGGGAVPIIQ